MEARWNVLQVPRLGKLEDVKYGKTVLKRILKLEGSNGSRLLVEVQNMFPLPHHAFGEECWTSNWDSGNVDATLQSAFEEDGGLECTVRELNFATTKHDFLFLVESNQCQSLTGQVTLPDVMYIMSCDITGTSIVLVHISWFLLFRLRPQGQQLSDVNSHNVPFC